VIVLVPYLLLALAAAACVSGIARHEAGVARARAHNPKDFR
jgi:hypothetical protein